MGTWHDTDGDDRADGTLDTLERFWHWLGSEGRLTFDDFLWWLGLAALVGVLLFCLHRIGWV